MKSVAELSGLVDCVDGRARGEGLVLSLHLQGPCSTKQVEIVGTGGSQEGALCYKA